MVTDCQVRRLFVLIKKEKSLAVAATKAGMDEETARKYKKLGKLPSQVKQPHTWKTREDPFEDIWDEAVVFLWNPGIEAKTVFEYLQRKYPGQFQDGQLRTFQRKVKVWRGLEGPSKEVYFPQVHYPGDLSASDFTSMNRLGISINGERFNHLVFHFILTYSNWETGSICFSESFESFAQGFQNACWELGGVTKRHRTDNFSAAIYSDLFRKQFTQRYKSLLKHYDIIGESIQARKSNENGDIEQSHNRFKKAVEQALILRGSRDFCSQEQYVSFLQKIFKQLNSGRIKRFEEELKHLRRLPDNRLEDYKKLTAKVGPSSTVSINHNVYSVHSRLIEERIEVRLYAEHIEIWYGQRKVDSFPRLRGEKRHHIQYRHIIHWLVRKPGAFENYRYRDDLFPTTRFRMAYDQLKKHNPSTSSKQYTQLLHLAATESEEGVDNALRILFDRGDLISVEPVRTILKNQKSLSSPKDVAVDDIDLSHYDDLLSCRDIGNREVLNGSRYS